MIGDSQRWLALILAGWLGMTISTSVALAAPLAEPTLNHPIVAGFERFFIDPNSDATQAGQLLFSELSCGACHSVEKTQAGWSSPSVKVGPSLEAVGSRIRPEYLREFIVDPQGTKPGTTMPNLLTQLPEEKRRQAGDALTHFLASTGRVFGTNPSAKGIESGRRLYQQIGCMACHGAVESSTARLATSIPLGSLGSKYTLGSLATFLADPLKARTSGRMPALGLTKQEAADLAAYLLRDLHEAAEPNLAYSYYEGRWENLPDFAQLKPIKTGKSHGIDLTVARRPSQFAIVFEGYLRIDVDGDYTFSLQSDDGSRLLIDGKLAVENDGIHALKERRGTLRMRKGTYPLVAAYFNDLAGGEFELDYSGPGIPRQPITAALSLTPQSSEPGSGPTDKRFIVDPKLVEQGRELFATIGCANCHQFRQNDAVVTSRLTAPTLATLGTGRGCLSPTQPTSAPHYPLSDRQRSTLTAAIESVQKQADAPLELQTDTVGIMTRLNCYACHQRADVGGVEASRNEFFLTKQKEMGDEGRLPPHLDGVGAKLTHAYLAHAIGDGIKDRPYMLTRMPSFGKANANALAKTLEAADSTPAVAPVVFQKPMRRVKSDGRYLIGGEALGCIKCHTFKGVEAEGIQAIDMTVMTKRLKRDWFHRYLVDPQVFRPGTRMPVAWPMGQSLLPKVLAGDTRQQIEAIWEFLSDGTKAVEPNGLGRDPIPLVPGTEPIIYRNFILGAGPRGIAVGYPGKANLAFDANEMRIAMIWQGAFIDASKHWSARGAGFQGPLGDNVLNLPDGPGFARLATGSAPWPTEDARSLDWKFRGYRLDLKGIPTFLYDPMSGSVQVADTPEPDLTGEAPAFRRTLTIRSSSPPPDLWFRAAVADKIEVSQPGWYRINGEWKLQIDSSLEPVIRQSAGKTELLVPLGFTGDEARIVERIVW